MERFNKIYGYNVGFETGYCHNPMRFSLGEKSNPFVAGYIEGFVDGGEFRDFVEKVIKNQFTEEDREMFRIINERGIKF